jgi:hypothetical protein
MPPKAKNSTGGNNPEILNLADYLSNPVANDVQDAEYFQLEDNETINQAEFEPEPDPEPETSETEATEAAEFMPAAALADVIVNTLDGIQVMTLPELIFRKFFTAAERETIANLSQSSMMQLSGTDAKLMERYRKHMKKLEKIPFNAGEEKRLKSSFTTVIKASNVKITPIQAALISMGDVMLKRATYFFQE